MREVKKWGLQSHFILPSLSVRFITRPQQRLFGSLAQLVEQRIENPCVPGSIPG